MNRQRAGMTRAIALVGALWSVTAAAAPEQPDHSSRQPHVFVLSAGASRGAHQAGMLYAVLEAMKARWEADRAADREAGREATREPEVAFVGAATGALNAMLGAIVWCVDEGPARAASTAGRSGLDWTLSTPDRNPLYQAWADLSLDALIPGDRSCADYRAEFPHLEPVCDGTSVYAPDDGLMTAAGLSGLRAELLAVFNRPGLFRPGCRVRLGFPLTAETTTPVGVEGQKRLVGVETSRRQVVMELFADMSGTLRVRPLRTDERGGGRAPTAAIKGSPALTLPRMAPHHPTLHASDDDDPANWIDPVYAVDALTAAVAYPVMFAPRPLTICAQGCNPAAEAGIHCPVGTHPCTDRFVNGGFFDAIPIALAHALRFPGPNNRLVVIGDADARAAGAGAPRTDDGPEPVGVDFLLAYLSDVYLVARQYEVQMLGRAGVLRDLELVRLCDRRAIMGDLAYGMGAFFHRAFAEHDFERGVLTGRAAIEQHALGDALEAQKTTSPGLGALIAWAGDAIASTDDTTKNGIGAMTLGRRAGCADGLAKPIGRADSARPGEPTRLVAAALHAHFADRAARGELGELFRLVDQLEDIAEAHDREAEWRSLATLEADTQRRLRHLADRMVAIDAAADGPAALWSVLAYRAERDRASLLPGLHHKVSGARGLADTALRLVLPSSVGGEALTPEQLDPDRVSVSDVRLHWDLLGYQWRHRPDGWLRLDALSLALLGQRSGEAATEWWGGLTPSLHYRWPDAGFWLWSVGARGLWWWYGDDGLWRFDRLGGEVVLRAVGGHIEVAGGWLDLLARGDRERWGAWQLTLSVAGIERLAGLVVSMLGE